MESSHFTATLLRTSSMGFASMAVSRLSERLDDGTALEGGFQAWQAHFNSILLELAAAVEDNSSQQFATKVGWTRDVLGNRGQASEHLQQGFQELEAVLEEALSPEAWAPLPAFLKAGREELGRTPPVAGAAASDEQWRPLTEAFLQEIGRGAGEAAIAQVLGAVQGERLTHQEAIAGVIGSVLREVGRRWHIGQISVAEEHFASQTCGRLLERILLAAPRADAHGRSVMLTNAEGDAHDLGLRIIAAFFELDGWNTICLGANTPPEDLARYATELEVDLLVIGATLNTQREATARAIAQLRQALPEQPILVGGPAFVGLEKRAREMGADACTQSPAQAIQLAHRLVEG